VKLTNEELQILAILEEDHNTSHKSIALQLILRLKEVQSIIIRS